MSAPINIVILGSTGSIGQQALEVIAGYPERFRIVGLSAQGNSDLLLEQWRQFRSPYLAIGDANLAKALQAKLPAEVKLLSGEDGLCELAALAEADTVLAAIAGMAGLLPVLAAIKAGKRIAIANKEPLVAAGELVTTEAARFGAMLFPVDSEHSALFQLLEGRAKASLNKIVLTGSGGPFRSSPQDLSSVTPQQALAHPTWKMGAKVTIDSATLMNKGLEIIEAHWLFGIEIDNIGVIIHPQSIIHAMVEFIDGSVLAHLAYPDMRIPIQYALGYPERLGTAWSSFDLAKIERLNFYAPDAERFPCLKLAREAAKTGGTAPAAMNAANEIAVSRFLAGEIKFTDIPRLVEIALQRHQPIAHPSLDEILEVDKQIRAEAKVIG